MEKSQEIKDLAVALNKFQGAMGTVVFDASNPFYKSKYATLSALVEKSKPILNQCGLSVSQLLEGEGSVTTILMHTSGQFLSSNLTLKAVKDDPQGKGSAITYSRRYAYAAILGIVSDEDDDGNVASIATQPSHLISQQQLSSILDLLASKDLSEKKLLEFMNLKTLEEMKSSDYQKAISLINAARKVAK